MALLLASKASHNSSHFCFLGEHGDIIREIDISN
jgi:hypothetical protein